MTTLFEELDKVLKEKNFKITCAELEIKSLKKEIEEVKKTVGILVNENAQLKKDVMMYQENEVNRHE